MSVPSEVRERLRPALEAARNGAAPAGLPAGWVESAADLLAEPDPGPTPFLVDQVLVDGAIGAVVGQHKQGKTWVVLELALAIVTGREAFGRFAVPEPGPVLVVLEESGRAALHRRLDSLRRGYGLEVSDLAELRFAANRRVRLDEPAWRAALLEAAGALQPRAVFLDPLVRLKGAGVDENAQKEMAPVLDFMRDLRDASGAAVVFVHHTGHEGGRLRGTSDLEAYWESKVTVRREPEGICEVVSEHREAEAGPTLRYRLAWHEDSRSMRLDAVDEGQQERQRLEEVERAVAEQPGLSAREVARRVPRNRQQTLDRIRRLERDGRLERHESEPGGTGQGGEGLYPADHAGSGRFPSDRNPAEPEEPAPLRFPVPPDPPFRGGGTGTGDLSGGG